MLIMGHHVMQVADERAGNRGCKSQWSVFTFEAEEARTSKNVRL